MNIRIGFRGIDHYRFQYLEPPLVKTIQSPLAKEALTHTVKHGVVHAAHTYAQKYPATIADAEKWAVKNEKRLLNTVI